MRVWVIFLLIFAISFVSAYENRKSSGKKDASTSTADKDKDDLPPLDSKVCQTGGIHPVHQELSTDDDEEEEPVQDRRTVKKPAAKKKTKTQEEEEEEEVC